MLIVYYSRKGQNYVSGRIVDLAIRNTETTEVAKDEMRANARPKLTDHVEDMDSYDVIFLAYPNW